MVKIKIATDNTYKDRKNEILFTTSIWKENTSYIFKSVFIFMIAAPFLTGIYYEYLSCLVSLLLLGVLIYAKYKLGKLCFRLNDASAAILIVFFSYGISAAISSSKGVAVWGIFKFFPIVLFLLILMQFKKRERLLLLAQLPFTATVMTILSCILLLIPSVRHYLLVNGRLGGFFQYPNTYAMYLLIGLIILFTGDIVYRRQVKIIAGVVLISGILLSGSRTVMGLTVMSGIFFAVRLIRRKNNDRSKSISKLVWNRTVKKDKWKTTDIFLLIIVSLVFLIVLILFGRGIIGRFLIGPLYSSTFLGRILYFKDGISQIVKYPLGMGYMGYYLKQPIFQSGVYSVMFVHNDWMQIFLDTGWIAGVSMLFAVLKGLFSKQQYCTQKFILLFLTLHCMFDFDLQYVYMFFLLLLVLDLDQEKSYGIHNIALGLLVFVAVAGIYIGIGNFVYYTGSAKTAISIYPYNTFAQIKLVTEAQTPKELKYATDQLMEEGDFLALAWNAKANIAFSEGDFGTVIEAKQKALSLAKYDIAAYQDYFEKLRVGVELYENAGNQESADICMQEIRKLQPMLDDVAAKTSSIAWKLTDKPQLKLPGEYQKYLDELQ